MPSTSTSTSSTSPEGLLEVGRVTKPHGVRGDVIVVLGERTISGADELEVAVREFDPGTTVPVQLVREGRPLTVSVVLASD